MSRWRLTLRWRESQRPQRTEDLLLPLCPHVIRGPLRLITAPGTVRIVRVVRVLWLLTTPTRCGPPPPSPITPAPTPPTPPRPSAPTQPPTALHAPSRPT